MFYTTPLLQPGTFSPVKLQHAYNRRFDQTNNHQVHLEENPRRKIDNVPTKGRAIPGDYVPHSIFNWLSPKTNNMDVMDKIVMIWILIDKSDLLHMDYQSVGLPRHPVQRRYREFYSENFEPEFRPLCVKRSADFSGMPHHYDRGITGFGPRPPIFEGKSDTWETLLMQFNLLAQSFNWTEQKYLYQLLFARISILMHRAYPGMEGEVPLPCLRLKPNFLKLPRVIGLNRYYPGVLFRERQTL